MDSTARQPRPKGVISPPTHTSAPPGPTEPGAATSDPQSSTSHTPANTSQPSTAPVAPSRPQQPQPAPTTQDSPNSSADPVISLAAALLGLPAAPGYYSPPDEVPGPWVDLLLEKHADGEVFVKLVRVSRSTREWVLEHSSKATLSVNVYKGSIHWWLWQRRLTRIQRELGIRGDLPTRLYICVDDTPEAACSLTALPAFIRGWGQSITVIEGMLSEDCALSTVFIRCMAPAAPNLSTLALHGSTCVLPAPEHLPHLISLTMGRLQHDSCVSIAPYLPQLTSLTLFPNAHNHTELFQTVFTQRSTTLTTFNTNTPLTDELLGLLLAHTPALTDLNVGPVTVQSDQYCGRVWGVKKLDTVEHTLMTQRITVGSWALPYLPTCSTGTVLCVREYEIAITDEEGIDPDVLERLSSWTIEARRVSVVVSADVDAAHHAATLTNVLEQLPALKTSKALTEFQGWQWTPAMAHSVAAAAPSLAHLKLGVHVDTLTDELLGVVLLMGPHMRRLSVGQLDLHSDQHADKTWPWDELTIPTFEVASLLRLPRPDGSGPVTLRCNAFNIHEDAIVSAGANNLTSWLQQVTWGSIEPGSKLQLCLHFPGTPDTSNDTAAVSLRSLLAVLKTLPRPDPKDRLLMWYSGVVLVGWPLTHEVMQALQDLPNDWDGALSFKDCTWPLSHKSYVSLATYVPLKFRQWHLGFKQPSVRRIVSILQGAEERRAELVGYHPFSVTTANRRAVQEVRKKVKYTRVDYESPDE